MKYCIIDLECTCWDRNDPNKEEFETIEIGTVFLDKDLNKIDELDLFVIPKHNPILSEYCIDLTGITQEELDTKGQSFESAIACLSEKISRDDVLFCSWGAFDKNVLVRECEDHRVEYPFNDEHHNIKAEFMKVNSHKKAGLQKACQFYKLRFIGTPHRGIDDANMIAEVFRKLRKEEYGTV